MQPPSSTQELFSAGQDPPFDPEVQERDLLADGSPYLSYIVRPEIFGKIKGIRMIDSNWTCYRKNYFEIHCLYSLLYTLEDLYLGEFLVHRFEVSVAAINNKGESLEIVQFKQCQERIGTPAPRTVEPCPPLLGISGDRRLGLQTDKSDSMATFDHIRFKRATANGCNRIKNQEYFYLVIGLYADVGQQHPDGRIRVAMRKSAPIVVRGNSPSYYKTRGRGLNAGSKGARKVVRKRAERRIESGSKEGGEEVESGSKEGGEEVATKCFL